MSDFKDSLWRELVREHGAELAQMDIPAHPRGRRRPRLLAGTSVGLAGIGTTVALALSAAGTSPAFAVTRNHDGTWSVTVMKLSAIPLANARLAALDVRARLVAVADGCAVDVPPKVWAERSQVIRHGVRFDPGKIPAGKTLVLAAYRAARGLEVASAHVVGGTAPVCLPPIIVPCLTPQSTSTSIHGAPPVGNTGNSGTTSQPPTSSTTGNSGAVPPSPRQVGELTAITAHNQLHFHGVAGFSCRVWRVARPLGTGSGSPANTGNTGNSGTSGNTGTTGNSGSATTGNSGSATTGNSGGS